MAKATNVTNFHMQYQDVTSQHWHPKSEKFAGGDNLITAIDNGWNVEKCVIARHYYAGMRFVKVFELYLARDGQNMTMPVVHNPYVERFIIEEGYELEEEESAAASA